MECTRCHKVLDRSDFSQKKSGIYYLHCNICMEKTLKNPEKKVKEKENYLFVKKNNLINCVCGKEYVSFREYHTVRHNNSKFHLKYISSIK